MNNAPLIFVHYGDCNYLYMALMSALKSNPDKVIVLIGDESNRKYEKIGVKHVNFELYRDGEMLHRFDKVYQRIGGVEFEKMNDSKGSDWTKFNFHKWFVLKNFLKISNISSFWTFDSDTLILQDLSDFEASLSRYDYTTMNDHNQLQGFVSNTKIVDKFCTEAIAIFDDSELLSSFELEFDAHPSWGLTMMRVFKRIHQKRIFKSIRLNQIEEQSSYFDECFCVPHNMASGDLEGSFQRCKTLFKGDGDLYEQTLENGIFIKLATINLSWISDLVFARIWRMTRINQVRRMQKVSLRIDMVDSLNLLRIRVVRKFI